MPRLGIVVALCLLPALGCVQRRLTLRSNPPGALVYIDNYEIGTTPCSTDYTYYGTRRIRLVRDGFETLEVDQFIPPPWYQLFPLDFVSENLVPYEFRDQRTLDFQLQPQMVVPTEQLLHRAEGLRRGAALPGFVPPQNVATPQGFSPPALIPQATSPTWPLPAP